MEPHVTGGWLTVPYDGPEICVIEIGFGGTWTPAYLDHEDGQRTAIIRHDGRVPAGLIRVRAGGSIVASWNIPAQPRAARQEA